MDRKLKVIHFITSVRRGGRERQLCTIVSHNDTEVQDIRIMYLYDAKESYIGEFGITEDKLIRIRAAGRIARALEIYRVLRKEKPDAVYSWGALESFYILLLKPLLKYHFINGSIRHGIVSRSLAQYWRMLLLHLSGSIVANSGAGLKANHLRRGQVLYNGIDPKFLEVKEAAGDILEFRKRLISPVFISVANLVPYKDYITVLNALSELRKSGKNFTYLVIGEGPERKNIGESIQKHGLEPHVHLLGSTARVAEYLSISDLFIHSSKGEGCSNAILEAMAAGLPVIASDTGGTSEIIRPAFGRLFPYQDATRLTSHLQEFIESGTMRKKMGEQARNEIIERFSIQRMMTDYYRILAAICSR